MSARRVLWAALPQETVGPDGLRFFPSEKDDSARLLRAEIRLLLEAPSPLYEAVIATAAARVSARLGVPAPAAAILLREPVVILTHLWLDRLVRLERFVRRHGADGLAIGEQAGALEPNFSKLRTLAASNPAFNQLLLTRLAPIWDIALAPAPSRQSPPPAPKRPTANLNFEAPSLPRRVRWKIARTISRKIGRIPSLSMAYAEWCFLDSGLIGRELAEHHGHWTPLETPKDGDLRRGLFSGGDALLELFQALGIDAGVRAKAAQAYESFMEEAFPAAFLEEIPAHWPKALAKLEGWKGRPLLASQTGDMHTTYLLTAAADLDMERVGVQHAVHYGFALTPTFTELEYPYFNRFISWGWDKMPDHPLCKPLQAQPLPSPWLSERRKRWRELRRDQPFAHDVLWMSDKLQRFPPSLNTNRHSRLDFLPELTLHWRRLVKGLNAAGLSVLHKPFDDASLDVIAGLNAELKADPLYRLHEGLDKGLTRELLESCALVIWDEPGTGPFECWVSGIPTLLLWTRDCSEETPESREDFRRLEEAGLVHRRVETLIEEARVFKQNPRRWQEDPARKAALDSVLRRYAWCEDDWAAHWRGALHELAP